MAFSKRKKEVAPPPPKPPALSAYIQAQRLCQRYWGPAAGEANDFPAFAKALRGLSLQKDDLRDLRDWLPTHAGGPCGDKIGAIDSLLSRMESGG